MKCILCSVPLEQYIRKSGYWVYRCPLCRLGQTDLKKDYSEFVSSFYSEGYYEGDPTRSAYVDYEADKALIRKNMATFLSIIRRVKKNGKLLDVGCALGYFVELSRESGYDAYGFDPSAFAVAKARKLVGGTRIKHGRIDSVSYAPKSFDIITLFDVFEHLVDPMGDLKRLRGLLKEDGIIIIATGNTQSVAARILGRKWTFYIPPQHVFFFDRANITTLFTRVGLSPVSWHTVGKWLSLGYVLHLARTTGENILASVLFPVFARTPVMKLPLYIPMRDNMVVVLRKAEISRMGHE